jgi:hypothetical protein
MTEEERRRLDNKHADAIVRYFRHYDHTLFVKAVDGKSIEYSNMLIDDALALCGSPWYTPTEFSYCHDAEVFLHRFVADEMERLLTRHNVWFRYSAELGRWVLRGHTKRLAIGWAPTLVTAMYDALAEMR